jgi:hypothetical protein
VGGGGRHAAANAQELQSACVANPTVFILATSCLFGLLPLPACPPSIGCSFSMPSPQVRRALAGGSNAGGESYGALARGGDSSSLAEVEVDDDIRELESSLQPPPLMLLLRAEWSCDALSAAEENDSTDAPAPAAVAAAAAAAAAGRGMRNMCPAVSLSMEDTR